MLAERRRPPQRLAIRGRPDLVLARHDDQRVATGAAHRLCDPTEIARALPPEAQQHEIECLGVRRQDGLGIEAGGAQRVVAGFPRFDRGPARGCDAHGGRDVG